VRRTYLVSAGGGGLFDSDGYVLGCGKAGVAALFGGDRAAFAAELETVGTRNDAVAACQPGSRFC
jgi:hypothetical protein